MTALPSSASFVDSAVTEAEFKTAITNQRNYLSGLFGDDGVNATALATLGAAMADTVAKSANYTVVNTDRGKIILCTGTFTLTLTAASTLGDGFNFSVINIGSGTITIDPNSTEQIDGASTKALEANSWAIVACNGTAFYTLGSVPATGALIGYQVFTSSGTYTKATNNPSYVIVEVQGGGSGGSGGAIGYSGSSGGYAMKKILASALASSVTVTVGAGGAASGNGGTSSFGSHVSATGGSWTTGAGGTGSNGDINVSGAGTFTTTGSAPARGAASYFGDGRGNFTGAGGGAYGSGGATIENTTGVAGVVIVWEYK